MAPPPATLLGPPEIQDYAPPIKPSQPKAKSSNTQVPWQPKAKNSTTQVPDANSFAILANLTEEFFNIEAAPGLPPMGFTENFSPTFLTSGNPCLDFFFQVVPTTPPEIVDGLLESAWEHDPLTTLKLIFQLRGVRGTGKSSREGFYTSALWLHKHHPKTLAHNVSSVAEFGYMKDLPEILHRLLHGADVRKKAKEERSRRHRQCQRRRRRLGRRHRHLHLQCQRRRRRLGRRQRRRLIKRGKKKGNCVASSKAGTREDRLAKEVERVKLEVEESANLRKEKRIEMALRALDMYNDDLNFRLLYDRIADYFASKLLADLEFLREDKVCNISLASKWCPSIDSAFDRSTLLCESIARRVFPRDSSPNYVDLEERHYAYRIRDRLRKEVLVPLRRALQTPEVYMSAKRWDELSYSRVPSVAMKNYRSFFLRHDGERFCNYLRAVEQGEAKIAAGALLPHEIVLAACPALSSFADEEEEEMEENKVAELQWKRMVTDLMEKGKLRSCMGVSDVSGSMSGTPMEVSIALGILTSELSEEPWKGKVITFSETPQLHKIEGNSLREKAMFVRNMDWGYNTNFQMVFDRILKVAVGGEIPPEEMLKRVLVFSDMEFDEASGGSWETDYEAIRRKFGEKGYGSAVPEIVFWNLRDSRSTPVRSNQEGVAMVSGFSKNLMTLFLDNDGALTPLSVMEAAIAGNEYEKLILLD